MSDTIDRILASRRAAPAEPEKESDKFFSIPMGDLAENYLEFQLRDGLRICLSYSDLSWFSYDPEGPKLDLEFGSIFVTIKGRGLGDELFTGIKRKQIAWIKEADSEMQDNKSNKVYIQEISFVIPNSNENSAE